MRGKANIKNLLLVIIITLVFTLNITNVLFNKNVYYAEESSKDVSTSEESSEQSSAGTLDIERVKQTTYEAILTGYKAEQTSKVPDELWKDGASKTQQTFNDAVLKELGVKSTGDITVKMVVEDIKKLDLSGLLLEDMPEVLFYMASLEDLNLSNNNFSVFDFSDAYLFSLKKIDISNNKKLISINAHDLGFLDELNASNCNLKTKSVVSIGQTLGKLNLSGNKIEAFKISNIEGLKELVISDGQLRYLEVTNCPQLGVIDAKNNALSAIKFDGLISLINLNLSNNLLTTVPNISASTNLSTGSLDISNNQITLLPDYLLNIGLTADKIILKSNLLDSATYGEQNALIIKNGVKVTITKDFDYNELLDKLGPYLAVSTPENENNAKPVSPNFSLKALVEDTEDTKNIETEGITKDFTASISVRLATAKEKDGLQTSSAFITIPSVDFKKDGESGVKIEGTPFSFNVINTSTDTSTAETSKSSSSSNKSSTASATTNSSGQTLPETGVSNMPKIIFNILIIAVLISIIKALIGLGVKRR